MSSIDAVGILRDNLIAKKPIKIEDRRLIVEYKDKPLKLSPNILSGSSSLISLLIPKDWYILNEIGWVSKTKADKVYTILDVFVFVTQYRDNPSANHLYVSEATTLKKEFKKLQFVLKDDQAEMFKYFTGQISTSEFLKESLKNQKMKEGGVMAPAKLLKNEETKMEIENEGKQAVASEDLAASGAEPRAEMANDKETKTLTHILDVYSAYLNLPEQKLIENDKNKKDGFFQQLLEIHKKNYGLKMQQQLKSRVLISKYIIIVPQKPQYGNLCLKNVKEFLIDGKFVEASTLKKESEEQPKFIEFTRKINGTEAEFEVWDDYLHLKHNFRDKL